MTTKLYDFVRLHIFSDKENIPLETVTLCSTFSFKVYAHELRDIVLPNSE